MPTAADRNRAALLLGALVFALFALRDLFLERLDAPRPLPSPRASSPGKVRQPLSPGALDQPSSSPPSLDRSQRQELERRDAIRPQAASARPLREAEASTLRPLRGRVVDAFSGRPIAGAWVAWRLPPPRLVDTLLAQAEPGDPGVSDAEGRFELARLPDDLKISGRM